MVTYLRKKKNDCTTCLNGKIAPYGNVTLNTLKFIYKA